MMELVPTCPYCGKPFAGEHRAVPFLGMTTTLYACPAVPEWWGPVVIRR